MDIKALMIVVIRAGERASVMVSDTAAPITSMGVVADQVLKACQFHVILQAL